MTSITENLELTRERIRVAEQKYRRHQGSVLLLAVSKTQAASAIRSALGAGQYQFGENHLQEALQKIRDINDKRLVWHFIGPIQSNKTTQIAENFSWVHSIDRLKTARRLSAARPAALPDLNVCIQVNISGEQTKSGISPADTRLLADEVSSLPGLHLRGLMVIPAQQPDFTLQRQAFSETRKLLEELNTYGMKLDTLSMGMSDDLEAAVAEGSTIVRIGTAIFGHRQT